MPSFALIARTDTEHDASASTSASAPTMSLSNDATMSVDGPDSPRRSRRGGHPSGGLSRDETALGVLRQCLKKTFKPVRDPNNVMKKILIRRDGGKLQDGVDGVDWIKEDGFTVAKYQAFWRKEMAAFDDLIVEWGHRLPAEAKQHLDSSLFVDDDVDDDVDDADDAAVAAAAAQEEKQKRGRMAAYWEARKGADKSKRGRPRGGGAGDAADRTGGKKKKQKAGADDHGADAGGDGLPEHLRALRGEWFGALAGGPHDAGAEREGERGRSRAAAAQASQRRERADMAKNIFVHNVAGCPKIAEYKRATLDPLARRAIAQVTAHVAAQAALLRNEYLAELALTNYACAAVDGPDGASPAGAVSL